MNKFTIASYNLKSIHNKFISLNNSITKQKIDIICLNETYLNENDDYLNLLQNYKIIRNDRSSPGGGVVVILNNNLSGKKVELESNEEYEVLVVDVKIDKKT